MNPIENQQINNTIIWKKQKIGTNIKYHNKADIHLNINGSDTPFDEDEDEEEEDEEEWNPSREVVDAADAKEEEAEAEENSSSLRTTNKPKG